MVSNLSSGQCFVLQLFNVWNHLILNTIGLNEVGEKMENKNKQELPRWKTRIEAEGLEVNVGKTKVMTGGEGLVLERPNY